MQEGRLKMPTYEITWEDRNGDHPYMRGEFPDFQAAVEAGLPSPGDNTKRLLRVEKIHIRD